ncbi:hypothetical protein DL95DRAFT_498625 [Leptodontidium sp. 2 PMI_412]|nr:hypothetical protein DL95DRAFT_498625 [Leptodontidium sp. 2 PMI_412]
MVSAWKDDMDRAGAVYKETLMAEKNDIAELRASVTEQAKLSEGLPKQNATIVEKMARIEMGIEKILDVTEEWKNQLSADVDRQFRAVHDRIDKLAQRTTSTATSSRAAVTSLATNAGRGDRQHTQPVQNLPQRNDPAREPSPPNQPSRSPHPQTRIFPSKRSATRLPANYQPQKRQRTLLSPQRI